MSASIEKEIELTEPQSSGSTQEGYAEALCRFDRAILAYKAQADPLTLLLLNKSAIPLMDAQQYAWQSIDDPGVLDPAHPFTAILAGPELSPPNVVRLEAPTGRGVRAAFTLVEFTYDARLSGRTAPDYIEALAKAREFIRDGTPTRTTNKAGAGTQGTKLVEGLGAVGLSLYVR